MYVIDPYVVVLSRLYVIYGSHYDHDMITTMNTQFDDPIPSEVSKHEHQATALRKAIQAARNAGVGHVTFQMEAAGHAGHRGIGARPFLKNEG